MAAAWRTVTRRPGGSLSRGGGWVVTRMFCKEFAYGASGWAEEVKRRRSRELRAYVQEAVLLSRPVEVSRSELGGSHGGVLITDRNRAGEWVHYLESQSLDPSLSSTFEAEAQAEFDYLHSCRLLSKHPSQAAGVEAEERQRSHRRCMYSPYGRN